MDEAGGALAVTTVTRWQIGRAPSGTRMWMECRAMVEVFEDSTDAAQGRVLCTV